MYETRTIKFNCGHEEKITINAGDRKGKEGRQYIDYVFNKIDTSYCSECESKKAIENGAEIDLRVQILTDRIIVSASATDTFSIKALLKAAGMRFDRSYNWHYEFKINDFTKEALEESRKNEELFI